MHKIYFYNYKDKNGHEPVLEYILTLSNRKDKESRIKLNKINDYIEILSKYGMQAGQPYTKHIVVKARREIIKLKERGLIYE